MKHQITNKLDGVLNYMVLLLFLVLFAFGCYALWDDQQIYLDASPAEYEIYKPVEGESVSFEELQALNPEVFGWLTVYGTQIDYPLVQGRDSKKYISTNAKGEFSMSGSIFLDHRNKRDMTDFNSIIYGHHMEKSVMFGDIERFADEAFFDSHKYGNLFANRRDYGLEFFAFLHADGFDPIYTPAVKGKKTQQKYLDRLMKIAMNQRDIGVTVKDTIVLLSTCAANAENAGNGRQILVARMTDETFADPFPEGWSADEGLFATWSIWQWMGAALVLLLIVAFIYDRIKGHTGKKRE